MSKAKSGDRVHVHYKGLFADQSVFDSSEGLDPLAFELGKGQVVPGFDRAVTGMEVGEKQTVTILSDDAYGPRVEQLVLTAPKENLPEGYEPQVGEMMGLETKDGHQMDVVITHVDEDSVKMDGNHPLAGKDLTFEMELVKIE
jgi:peptidylprolyl isomerase